LNWNWNPNQWKRSTKILLGLATLWPVGYMLLFMFSIFSFMLLIPFAQERSTGHCGDLDLIQLSQKIQNGELEQLTVRRDEIVATDRVGNCEYHTSVTSERTRAEILRQAREPDANSRPRVPRVEEDTSSPRLPLAFPIGFVALFAAHMFTILLIMGLMPLYIILAVKSDRLDQTTRIIWIILLCMMSMFAMPVYWYLYIWRDPPVGPANESVAQPAGEGTSAL
jgi:hypothetical protein